MSIVLTTPPGWQRSTVLFGTDPVDGHILRKDSIIHKHLMDYPPPARHSGVGVQMLEKTPTLSFLGRRSFAPRPLSDATEIFDTDFEDDSASSTPVSMESMEDDKETTASSPPLRTPNSAGLGAFDFHFEDKPVMGPRGPHLFSVSVEPEAPMVGRSKELEDCLGSATVVPFSPSRPISSLTRAVAELDETQVRSWSPHQVADWMSEAGFDATVVEKFLAHDICGVVLLDLQFEDLKELDITSYGKRHRVMSSIQQLRNSSMLTLKVPCTNPPARRGRQQRRPQGDHISISPAESVSIVAIEQVLPKPHKCSKGQDCPKWLKQQRKIQRLREEFPTEAKSDAEPSVVASSDALGAAQRPALRITPESLSGVRPRDPQENVRQFLSFQHLEPGSTTAKAPPLAENLRSLPKLTIPIENSEQLGPYTARSLTPANTRTLRRSKTPVSAIRHASPVMFPLQTSSQTPAHMQNSPYSYTASGSTTDVYRVASPLSEVDVPVTALPLDPVGRDNSQSVPADMRYGVGPTAAQTEPIRRPSSASTRRLHHRHGSILAPSITPLPEDLPGLSHVRPDGEPRSALAFTQPIVSDVQHSGQVRKRKTTRLLRHEWQDAHFTLKGTKLAMYSDHAAAEADARRSKALEYIDVDDYAVACSSLASSSKLSAAFKRSILGSREIEEKAFAFSLVPEARKIFATSKSHHFSVKTRDERIDWMRELMLAKALKRSKENGREVHVNGNLI